MTIQKFLPVVLIVLGYAPILFMHLYGISKNEQYQHWPFVVAAIAYLLWTRRKPEQHIADQGGLPTLSLQLLAFVLLLFASLTFTPWAGAASAVIALGALIVAAPSIRYAVNAFGIWMLGWLLIPPPFGIDGRIVRKLQTLSSSTSSHILDVLGIDHLMLGNILQVTDKQFFVDEACSGIVSVMSIIAAGAIYAVWKDRTYLHTVILLLLGACWAVVMNIARLVTIAVAHQWMGLDLSSGAPHEVLGLVLFTLTFVALMSTDQSLCFVLGKIPDVKEDRSIQQNAFVVAFNRIAGLGDPLEIASRIPASTPKAVPHSPAISLVMSAMFALVGIAFTGVLFAGSTKSKRVLEQTEHITESTLPRQLGRLELTSYETQHRADKLEFGEYSNLFTYALDKGDRPIQISFDYPFPAEQGWKELTTCYRGIGWRVLTRDVLACQSSDGLPWNVVHVVLENSIGELGYLWFSHFDGQGEPVSPPDGFWAHAFWTRGRRFKAYTQSPHMFQSQLWTAGRDKLSDEELAEFLNHYLASRERFRSDFVGGAMRADRI